MQQRKYNLNNPLIICMALLQMAAVMFVSSHTAIIPESCVYYSAPIPNVVLLAYISNLCYLVMCPLLFPLLSRFNGGILQISVLCIIVGSVVRYLVGRDYLLTLFATLIVGVGYGGLAGGLGGVLGLFSDSRQAKNDTNGFAMGIGLGLPSLGANLTILYSLFFILNPNTVNDIPLRQANIQWLNLFIATLALLSGVPVIILLAMQKHQIGNHHLEQAQHADGLNEITMGMKVFHQTFRFKLEFLMLAVSWGTIAGINWGYGDIFPKFFKDTMFTNKDITYISLASNISSIVLTWISLWIPRSLQVSRSTLIFLLLVIGFLSSLFLQGSSTLPQEFFHNTISLAICSVLVRACFSSFLGLAFLELSEYGPQVLVWWILTYFINGAYLISMFIMTGTRWQFGIGIVGFLLWLAILGGTIGDKWRSIRKKQNTESRDSSLRDREEQETQNSLRSANNFRQLQLSDH